MSPSREKGDLVWTNINDDYRCLLLKLWGLFGKAVGRTQYSKKEHDSLANEKLFGLFFSQKRKDRLKM